MKYHLKLSKALSYCGVVTATHQHPDVIVEDKATANAAVATGYFKLVEAEETPEETTEETPKETPEETTHLDRAQLEEMKVEDLKQLAADMRVDTTGFKKKADYVAAIAAAEVIPGPETDEEGNEADYGEGSPTMVELQEQP